MSSINLELTSADMVLNNPEAGNLKKEDVESSLDFNKLTSDEQNIIKEFMQKINVSDTAMITSYGSSTQNKIAQFADSILNTVKTKDMGEAGKMLSNLSVEIKNFDNDLNDKGGIFGFLNNQKKQLDKMLAKYDKVEVNVDKIVDVLEGHKRQLLKDVTMFDAMFDTNVAYFKELSMYIIAGDEKLKEVKNTVLPEMRKKAEESSDQMDVQKLNDMNNLVNRFEKKIYDLKLSRMVSLQMGPQIRMIQNNDTELMDKIQSSILNAIPLWKNQMVIALGLTNAKSALHAQRQVTEMTNELLKKNSEMLKMGTIEIAKESERGIIDIETVKKTNQDLIFTIGEVIKIQQEGSQKRAAAESDLIKLENELKSKLLELRK